jgi:methylthioribose-1-phosphate isomerase
MRYAIEFKAGKLKVVDQTKLPGVYEVIEITTLKQSFDAIRALVVRGAPLIGVFAAYAVWIGLKDEQEKDQAKFLKKAEEVVAYLKTSRPTAVNLFWALERVRNVIAVCATMPVAKLKKRILDEARAIDAEDKDLCVRIGEHGAALVKNGARILTHCNAGYLATAGDGTALSVIYAAAKTKTVKVYSDETRPLLQGSRLTAWELAKRGIDVTQICDNTAGYLMQKGMIDMVVLGADRITANGGVANKIGTYTVAVLAKRHSIPFYVAAPSTTFDLSIKDIKDIPIEERDPNEVRYAHGVCIAPKKVKALNYAFDTTPPELITGIITENGVITPPFAKNIAKIVG